MSFSETLARRIRALLGESLRGPASEPRRAAGPEIAALAEIPRGLDLEEERRRLAAMGARELVRYLAARFARRRPRLEELRALIGGRAETRASWGVYFGRVDHPLLTHASVITSGAGDEVRWLAVGGPALELPLRFLVESFGEYGGFGNRLNQSRDDPTDFELRRFRGGALQMVAASGERSYWSPFDRPPIAGNLSRETIERALAAAGRRAEGSLLTFDPAAREYRAVGEDEIVLTRIVFSFERYGTYGALPWRPGV